MSDVKLQPSAGLDANRDPEIVAMQKLSDALSHLDPAVRSRVLRWAADRFEVSMSLVKKLPAKESDSTAAGDVAAESAQFPDFASLFDATNPQTDSDKALVAGYWLQVIGGQQDWDGYSANKALTHLGHRVVITNALTRLIEHTPRLVIQTRKSGTTRQAKKKYKLTAEGVKRVRQMLAGTAPNDNEER